jgi:hypothetical protein
MSVAGCDGAAGVHCSGRIVPGGTPPSEVKQARGIAAENLHLVLVAQRHPVHPLGRRPVFHERPVDGEQHAVDPQLHHRAQQGRIGEIAARGDVEIAAEHAADELFSRLNFDPQHVQVIPPL